MSSYDNVVRGKLNLKGKALDVKSGSLKKKRKKDKQHFTQIPLVNDDEDTPAAVQEGGGAESIPSQSGGDHHEDDHVEEGENARPLVEDLRTPAEKRYHEQKLKLDAHRLAKTANKSHRERIEGFNQYLANLSEHYDIPKVGPG